jgi:hypothetical protein
MKSNPWHVACSMEVRSGTKPDEKSVENPVVTMSLQIHRQKLIFEMRQVHVPRDSEPLAQCLVDDAIRESGASTPP